MGLLRKSTSGKMLDIALRETRRYARRTIHARIARAGYDEKDVKEAVQPKGFVKWVAAAALTRLATRSLPGALTVGGVVLAKALLDRRKPGDALEEAAEAVDDTVG
jgi:hypothetical protein